MAKKKPSAALALVSPAARPPTSRQTRKNHVILGPSRVVETITALEKSLGGRQGLIEALSVADTVPEVFAVLQHIGDPRFDRWPLARICAECQIAPGLLFDAVDRAALLRAQILARATVAAQTPAMVGELLRLTRRHDQPCTPCNGTGKIYDLPDQGKQKCYTCTSCQGAGTFQVEGDLERQKIALGMMRLTEKAGGITVQTQINTPAPAAASSLVQLQQVVTDLLYGPTPTSPAIPTEVVPDAPTD